MPSRTHCAVPLFCAVLFLVTTMAPGMSRAESPNSEPVPGHVSAGFEKFVHTWVSSCQKSFQHTLKKMLVRKENGLVIMGYTMIDKDSITWKLKPTRSAQSPFVGILSYTRSELESSGPDLHSAKNGQFKVMKNSRITEIFRYSNGIWQQ